MLTDVRQWHAWPEIRSMNFWGMGPRSCWTNQLGEKRNGYGICYGPMVWVKIFQLRPADLGHFYPILEVLEVQIWFFLVSNICICIFEYPVFSIYTQSCSTCWFFDFPRFGAPEYSSESPINWPRNLSGVHQSLRGYFTYWGPSSNIIINDHNHNHDIYDNPIDDNNPIDDLNPIDDHLLNETGLIIHFHNSSSLSMINGRSIMIQYHNPVS